MSDNSDDLTISYMSGLYDGRKEAADEIERQAAELRSLREALHYYADASNWHVKYGDSYILVDGGSKARAALGEGK